MPKSKIIYFAIIVILLTIILSSWNNRTGRYETFEEEMKSRAQGYIRALVARPLPDLKLEEKLLLLHSYYVAGDYGRTVDMAEFLGDDLKNLPQDRRDAFNVIIRDAYIKAKAGVKK